MFRKKPKQKPGHRKYQIPDAKVKEGATLAAKVLQQKKVNDDVEDLAWWVHSLGKYVEK
jgi:hypothetical protein